MRLFIEGMTFKRKFAAVHEDARKGHVIHSGSQRSVFL